MEVTLTHQGAVSTISFRGNQGNLLNPENMQELTHAHLEADAHPDTRVIVTRSGTPGIFCNGLDSHFMLQQSIRGRIAVMEAMGTLFHRLYALGKPHIALLEGPANAGGAVLALTADFRIFSPNASICFPETKIGLPMPEALITILRQTCHGPGLKKVVMLGQNLDSHNALEVGLADAVTEQDPEPLLNTYCQRLSRPSPTVMRETKKAMRNPTYQLTKTLAHREKIYERYVGPGFLEEGLTALLENRYPNFVE